MIINNKYYKLLKNTKDDKKTFIKWLMTYNMIINILIYNNNKIKNYKLRILSQLKLREYFEKSSQSYKFN